MTSEEYLLTTSHATHQWTSCLWDYNTLNAYRLYRNGGICVPRTLNLIGNDYLITAELNKPLLHVWPVNTQEPSKNIRMILPEPATCLDIHPENCYLAVGINVKLYIWHLNSGKLLSVQQKHFQPITCVKFSSDGAFVVVTGQDGMLVVYNFANLIALNSNYLIENQIGHVEPIYSRNDHSLPITDLHLGSFGRKSRLATVSTDQTARLYVLQTGDLLLTLTFDFPLNAVVFDACCFQLFVGATTGLVKQFNLHKSALTVSQHVNELNCDFVGHCKKVVCLALNSFNNILASGSEDNFVHIWEVQSRQLLRKIEHKGGITNVRFVMDHKNFQIDILRANVCLKSLHKTFDSDKDDIDFCLMASEDIKLDDEYQLSKDKLIEDLKKTNRQIRTANRELFKIAMDNCLKK